jgi:hypothetical protein
MIRILSPDRLGQQQSVKVVELSSELHTVERDFKLVLETFTIDISSRKPVNDSTKRTPPQISHDGQPMTNTLHCNLYDLVLAIKE